MPIYEYRCVACDNRFELLVRNSVEPACPSCGALAPERLISLFAVSSDGTNLRNRQALGAAQRVKSAQVQKERAHFRNDHHDD